MTDEKLIIKKAAQGDSQAFEQLVLAHEDRVYNLCLRMTGNPEDAADLAQEAFIKAWRGLSFYKFEASFSTWLYRLTSNVCIDFLRRRKRRDEVSLTTQDEQPEQIELPDLAPSPEEQMQTKQLRQAVASAMEQLEEEFRMVLTLRVVEELSYEEIAQIMDLKVGTVKSRLARAREKLRKILIQNGNDFDLSSVKPDREGNER